MFLELFYVAITLDIDLSVNNELASTVILLRQSVSESSKTPESLFTKIETSALLDEKHNKS